MSDLEKMADDLLVAVKGYVSDLIGDVAKRMEVWEARLAVIPAGPKGDKGDAGESIRGEPGEPGKDAEPVNIGDIVARVAAALPEPVNGKDGAPGRDSVDGINGKDGSSIHPDTVALMVREAVDKAVAAIPQTLAADGRDGRDAAQIEPLPEIDEKRNYPRGTWAKHAGGLWLARAPTDGMTGWDCIVDGVAQIGALEAGDVRSFKLSIATSSGKNIALPFTVPAMIYREVWREGEFDRGDVVTWGGSAWHCQAKTTDKPGMSAAWKMMVKEGRPGKDAAAHVQAEPKTVRLK